MRAKDALGRFGEDVAARYLSDLGMRVLERNWHCDIGEENTWRWICFVTCTPFTE